MERAMRGKLASVAGIRRKKDEQANKDIRIQNQAVLVDFRSAYVFERSSRDLRPGFYSLDVTRDTPRVPAKTAISSLNLTALCEDSRQWCCLIG